MKNYTKTYPGERIDHPDFNHTAVDGQLDADIEVPAEIIVGEESSTSQPRSAVIRGWSVDQPVGTTTVLRIVRGALLAGMRTQGGVKFGLLVAGGAAEKQIDIQAIPSVNGYKLWIRYDFRDAEITNRIFWDTVLIPPQEVPRNVATRIAEDWSYAVELSENPGDEWVLIATFDKSGGVITNLKGARDFLFEGRENAVVPFQYADLDWGTLAADRSDVRAVHGIKSLKRWVKAVNRQLQDIIGVPHPLETGAAGGTDARWYRKVVKALSEVLPLDGSRRMIGSIIPETNILYDLGSILPLPLRRWRNIYTNSLNADDAISVKNDLNVLLGNLFVTGGNLQVNLGSIAAIAGAVSGQTLSAVNQLAVSLTPAPSTVYANNIVVARGLIETDGAGAIVLLGAFDFNCSVSIPLPNEIRVTFLQPMTETTYSVVLTQDHGIGTFAWHLMPDNRGFLNFTIKAISFVDGFSTLNFVTGEAIRINFQVVGVQ